ncbi:serine/threonine-protein kinase [Nonomuraea purpurea]|uniref:non-specific serine/threonine protein kinase n=1 Tax=Nonomuraea purpurea TaxID=1849276 RepID=A0ABV8G3Z5_9ACTN
MPGDLYLLAGRYRLIERLGQGGAGTVWRAIDEILDRQVAVKQVRVPEGLTPRERAEFADRAIHEARSAGRLRDPAIVVVHDVVLEGDQPWIIMDIVSGRSLDKVIREQGPLPPAFVAAVGLRVLSALEVAHTHGMLHHDVKPANILLEADGSAMLTDFGIAVPVGGGHKFAGAGSPGYMAPERLNEQPSGPASDLWSLGASLYTAVEGRAPFERELSAAVVAAVLLHEPPFPARAGRELGGLLVAMLAKDPAVRPTASQVRQVLTGLAGGAPVPRSATGKRRWLLPAVLAAVVALGAGGWYAAGALRGGPETGRFVTAPDPCELLGDADAARLMKGRPDPDSGRSRPGECQWIIRDQGQNRRLVVRVWAEKPNGDLSGPQVAERRFTSEKSTRGAAEGAVSRDARGKVGDVDGVGESAIVQNAFRFYLNSNETGTSDSILLFRTSNLLGEVIWRREDVPASAPEDKAPAEAVARLVSQALSRSN